MFHHCCLMLGAKPAATLAVPKHMCASQILIKHMYDSHTVHIWVSLCKAHCRIKHFAEVYYSLTDFRVDRTTCRALDDTDRKEAIRVCFVASRTKTASEVPLGEAQGHILGTTKDAIWVCSVASRTSEVPLGGAQMH